MGLAFLVSVTFAGIVVTNLNKTSFATIKVEKGLNQCVHHSASVQALINRTRHQNNVLFVYHHLVVITFHRRPKEHSINRLAPQRIEIV